MGRNGDLLRIVSYLPELMVLNDRVEKLGHGCILGAWFEGDS